MHAVLTTRQIKFLRQAFKIAPKPTDVFLVPDVASALGWSEGEGTDMFASLFRTQPPLVEYRKNYTTDEAGGSVEVPGSGKNRGLTREGREAARQTADDIRAKRWGRFWKVFNVIWPLFTPLLIGWITAKFSPTPAVQPPAATRPLAR
jgi:hypothetical protein